MIRRGVYRRPRELPPTPRALVLLAPLAALLAGAGLAVGIALHLDGGQGPAMIQSGPQIRDAAPGSEPFSLAELHRRLPEPALRQVGRYLDYFRNTRRRGLEGALARSTRYLRRFKRIFRKAGLPEELAYLPLIESGYVENAVSPAQAVGMWQFTAETARRFNLVSNPWFDRRRDPDASARAAARYLRQLHRRFNNWDLALAAYNSGAGTVGWALRVNRKAGLPTHFWALSELPEETRNYVPAFLAAVLIARNLDVFGFDKIRFMPRMTFERIKVSPGISLTTLAQHLEIDEASLYELNPELIRRRTPPGDSFYLLRIPPGTRRMVRSKFTGGKATPRDWMLHRVSEGDTVQTLATRFRALPDRILRFNRIQDNRELAAREFVIIPL